MSATPDFSDLDADLDAEAVTNDKPKPTFFDAQVAYATGSNPEQVRAQDKCRACAGSGTFHSKYTGRAVGPCFRCKGTGSVSKGTNERVDKARVTKAANEQRTRNEQALWRDGHADVLAWINKCVNWNDFARSLLKQYQEKGKLSSGQVESVRESILRDAQREADKAKATAANEPTGSGLDLSTLPEGTYAVPDGDTRLKVKIERPAAPSKWAGWVFVSDGAEYGHGQKYGRQAPGKTYSGMIVPELTKIAADPRAAAAAYGHLTGRCAMCGKKLEDEQSVARGIGPICFGKFNKR